MARLLAPPGSPQDKREHILAAALTLFAERGFHGTAVPLVAEKAEVAAGTVYNYFKSKEELVNALYRKWKTSLVEDVLFSIPKDAPARKQLHLFWERMGLWARRFPDGFQFLEMHHHAPYLDEESKELEGNTVAMLQAFMREAQRKREMRRDVRAEVLMAIAYGAFLGLWKAQAMGLPLTDDVLEEAEEAVWDTLRHK